MNVHSMKIRFAVRLGERNLIKEDKLRWPALPPATAARVSRENDAAGHAGAAGDAPRPEPQELRSSASPRQPSRTSD